MAQSLTHGEAGLPADWRDLFALTKPRVMSLVVFTALCGLLAAPGHVGLRARSTNGMRRGSTPR
jgi:protoheme IX farnesyltransferase